MSDDDETVAEVARVRVVDGVAEAVPDVLVREEPLEIRVNGVPLVVTMRTPGHDEELARGFLVTERVVSDPAQIRSIRPCDAVEDPESEGNVWLVTLQEGADVDLARHRRNFYASSSCGLCGKATIETALAHADPLADDTTVGLEVLLELPTLLRAEQRVFTRTGGLHGAGLFTREGRVLVVREDVGRHNAVDKVVGWAARHDVRACILMVSGRVSYEIVQKALAARIPVIAAVSAPSSLAVDLAAAGGITLTAFVRERGLSIYTGAQRVLPDQQDVSPAGRTKPS